jgi:hypothetical protein
MEMEMEGIPPVRLECNVQSADGIIFSAVPLNIIIKPILYRFPALPKFCNLVFDGVRSLGGQSHKEHLCALNVCALPSGSNPLHLLVDGSTCAIDATPIAT